MGTDVLQALGQIAGIGGISVGVALVVFRDVIRKNIFPKFKDEHLAYRLLRLVVVLSWTIAVLGTGAWLSVNILEARTPATVSIVSADFAGDFEVETLEFIVNQYVEITGGPIADPEIVARLERATNLIRGGRYDSALPLLEEVAEVVDIPAVHNNLGALYAVNGRFDEAERAFEKAVEREPENPAVQLNLGMLAVRRGDVDGASRHLGRAEIYQGARVAVGLMTTTEPIMRTSSQFPGLDVELIEFSRFENMITVKVRFISAEEVDRTVRPTNNFTSYLIDEATGATFQSTIANNVTVTVPAGGSAEFWAKYGLPEGDIPRYLSVVFNYGILFEHIEVP